MSCSGYGLDTFTCFWCLGMMLTGQKGTNTPSLLKWKQRGSALTTRLLNNIPSEVELSDLGRIPSSGSESPSGLLNGEGLNAEPIADLDLFFERIYNYYCEKGLWCIIIKWVVELLGLGFTICFSGFFLLFVDWNGLRNAKCGMDAVESGLKPCDLSKEALHQHPLTPLTLSKSIIVGYLAIFSIYWIFCFLKFFAQLKDTLSIRHFYYNSLYLTDNEIQTMPWASVLEKVVNMQSSQKLCVVKDLDAHDVVMRLMRKENYLIGMLNKGIIAFPISKWFPGAGPTVKHAPNCRQYRLMLTKTLEWTLNWCILQSMFDRNFCVQKDFIYNPKTLKKRLVLVGLVMLLLSPFLVIFMLVYLFLRHAEQFYNHPGTASSRRWSNLSRWVFREFNEVDHLFKHRINSSFVHASEYLRQFPSPIISIIAKFISFISGGFAAILIIIAFLEESLLEGHIFGRNLFWYAAVFGTITAISRAAVTEELLVLDPEGAMSQLVQHSHYMPKRWRGKENTEIVRMEIETLYQYTGMMLLEEMASIFLTPYLLMFIVPKRVDDILQFIADFTVDIEGVGHVCSFSVFDFQNHGNNNYGSPYSSSRAQRSSQGKMEKSFLSFQSSYPSWEPNAQGKQFLSMLRHFKEQNSNSPTRTWRGNPNLRVHNSSRPDNHFDSLRLIDPHEKTHPYLLDLYYTSRSRRSSCIIPPSECLNDFWAPPDLTQNELKYEHYSVDPFEDQLQSHLEASASTSLFPESEFRERNLGSAFPRRGSNSSVKDTGSHWWARGASRGENPHASFLEPPGFHHYIARSGRGDDGLSEKSVEEEEGRWGRSSRNLSTTAEFEVEGDVRLHFDDIYSGPLDATYSSSFG